MEEITFRYYVVFKDVNDILIKYPVLELDTPKDYIVEAIDTTISYEENLKVDLEELSKSVVMELGPTSGYVKLCDIDIDVLFLLLKESSVPNIYRQIVEFLIQEKRNESIDDIL